MWTWCSCPLLTNVEKDVRRDYDAAENMVQGTCKHVHKSIPQLTQPLPIKETGTHTLPQPLPINEPDNHRQLIYWPQDKKNRIVVDRERDTQETVNSQKMPSWWMWKKCLII